MQLLEWPPLAPDCPGVNIPCRNQANRLLLAKARATSLL